MDQRPERANLTPLASTCDIPVRAALDYVARGWHVFPLAPASKQPATVHGYHDATTDPALVRQWWSERPKAGIGIACIDSGLVVIDVDPAHGGDEAFAATVENLGPLPETVEGATGGGGRHLLFRRPDDLDRARGNITRGLDVKLHGYIVAPPSLHPSGNRYAWKNPPEHGLAQLPAAWVQAIRYPAYRRQLTGPTPRRAATGASTHYGLAALEGECSAVKNAPDGARNNRLNQAAFRCGQLEAGGELDESDSNPALRDAATACGLSEREAQRTIDSGRRSGRLQPRSAPPKERTVPGHAPARDDEAPWPGDEFEAEGEEPWTSSLVFRLREDGSRVLDKTPGNLALLLAHSEGWAGTLSYNELSGASYWTGSPPELEGFSAPRGKLTDEHVAYVRQWMRQHHHVDWNREAAWDGIALAAAQHRYHPVQRYLEGLEWDGVPRVGSWVNTYFPGTEMPDMPIGGWWLISAVARAMRPGCQADHMLVLEGPQGAGKSTAASILGDEWFSAELGDVRDKDAAQSLAGVWIMEVPELDALRKADMTRTKTFLTLRCDHFRPSYGRTVVDRPRQCVFMGTTNERKYLHDASGGRRFWPVSVKTLDAEALYRDRDQLWAEALRLYRDGERWWPTGQAECAALSRVAEERFAQDPWEPKLAELMASTTERWTIERLLSGPLNVPIERQDRAAATRVGTVMSRLGLKAKRFRINGVMARVFEREDSDA